MDLVVVWNMLKISKTALIVIGKPALPRRPEPWIQAWPVCLFSCPHFTSLFPASQHWYLDFLLHHIDIWGEIFQDSIFFNYLYAIILALQFFSIFKPCPTHVTVRPLLACLRNIYQIPSSIGSSSETFVIHHHNHPQFCVPPQRRKESHHFFL